MAQDVIYTANGNRLPNARITDITDDRVVFSVLKDNVPSTYSLQRQNVLVAFRKGNFLVVSKLSPELDQAKQELQTFLTTTVWQDKDFLLRAVPFEVIPAKISLENDDIVNYLTNDGKSASISKGELIAIFYKDGRHSLIREATEIAPILATVQKPLSANSTAVPPQTTNVTPASAPEPAPIKKPDLEATVPSANSDSPSATPARPTSKLVLSEEEYQQYRKKALDRVEEFASYLKIIANKSNSDYERNQAIEQAVSLFMPASTMEVTSNSQPGARRYPIRTYLTNLKRLNYKSVNIEWTEIQYLKELSQAADGNYYGVITGQQTFIGYGRNTQYTDITQKNVRVKLERYHMVKNGQDDVRWNLLLGSIGVSAQAQ
ncbi:hypothetical protein ACFSUS_05980 [Spirosoma soli]|uniref:Uncharacterized protein n=1 Tax=Spirosoma soli TaxID=1770529 RepID=A0ABW5LZZ5_9BACT